MALHAAGDMTAFLQRYFDHELEKGKQFLSRFEAYSENWPTSNVLDFGCGGGGLTIQLGNRFREAWGIDLDQEKLDFAGRQRDRLGRTNVHFRCYDGITLPFDDGTFDTIFCVDVVEHLPHPHHFIQEFERVLRPGGRLLLSFGPPWKHAHGKHQWTKLPGWWTHLLFPRSVVMEVRGFKPDTTWEEIGLHRLTVGKFERIMKRSRFRPRQIDYRINASVRPVKSVPVLREYFISEVVGVFDRAA